MVNVKNELDGTTFKQIDWMLLVKERNGKQKSRAIE